jgi:putative DNA primase/helicase
LHNRVGQTGDGIYYDLCDDDWSSVKITKEGWEVVDNPCIFRRIEDGRNQARPIPTTNKRYLMDKIFYKSTIKSDYQKLIAEVYVISLFFPDIAHPMIIPIGPKAAKLCFSD